VVPSGKASAMMAAAEDDSMVRRDRTQAAGGAQLLKAVCRRYRVSTDVRLLPRLLQDCVGEGEWAGELDRGEKRLRGGGSFIRIKTARV